MHQNIMYLVMELLEGGTLADRIKQHPQGMPEEQAMTIFRQILSGYQRIKDKQIIHRDLKPDNILFR
jgi:serine/threonine protein kinase